jgi:DNA-directed RNA polymerase specialized sigma24 family protein
MLTEHYIDGYDIQQVALKNGKSTASVYKMFQRLKAKLKKHYSDGGDENE